MMNEGDNTREHKRGRQVGGHETRHTRCECCVHERYCVYKGCSASDEHRCVQRMMISALSCAVSLAMFCMSSSSSCSAYM